MGWGRSTTPNPQLGGSGHPFLSESSPLTCPALKILPVVTLSQEQLSGSSDHASPITASKQRHLTEEDIPSCIFFPIALAVQSWVVASSFTRFLDHTQRRTTVSRTPLDKWSVRGRDLYLTTHNTHNRQTSMPQAEFEPTISAGERPQTYASDRAATGTGISFIYRNYIIIYNYVNQINSKKGRKRRRGNFCNRKWLIKFYLQ